MKMEMSLTQTMLQESRFCCIYYREATNIFKQRRNVLGLTLTSKAVSLENK